MEEKNTIIKYRGAQAGQVRTLGLARSNEFVKVTARLTASAKDLARVGSVFWIVRPELKIGGISGLRTIISGEYIAVQPGNGPRTNTFVGAESEPRAEPPGALHITLLAPNLGSLHEQTSISYRGIQVGEVLQFQLGEDSREVAIRA